MQISFVQAALMARSVTEVVTGTHAKSIYQLPGKQKSVKLTEYKDDIAV